MSWIVRQIHHLIDTERDLALSSIVIAARTDSLLDDYQSALSKRGIKTLQISRNIPDDPNAAGVRSATLHRLKGLEFRAVFIVGADEGNIPDALTLNESRIRMTGKKPRDLSAPSSMWQHPARLTASTCPAVTPLANI